MRSSENYVVCPFCKTVHKRTNIYLNVICSCGGKYYPCSGKWINRQTGAIVEGLANNRCDCKACPQHRMNRDETGFKCISYGFVIVVLKNILECVDALTESQRDVITRTINMVEELDKQLEMNNSDSELLKGD